MCNCQFQLIMFAIFYLGRAALAAILSAFESQQYQGNYILYSAVLFFEEKMIILFHSLPAPITA